MANAASSAEGAVTLAASVDTPIARAHLQRLAIAEPIDVELAPTEDVWLDLCLTPRTPEAQLSFRGHWPAHRYERPGKLFVVPPGEAVRARSEAGHQESVICYLRPEAMNRWLDAQVDWTRQHLETALDLPSHPIKRLLARLGSEIRQPGFASEAMCEAIMLEIAIELGRYSLASSTSEGGSTLSAWRLRLIEERLAELKTPPTLERTGGPMRHLGAPADPRFSRQPRRVDRTAYPGPADRVGQAAPGD